MASKVHILIVEARFYPELSDELLKGAVAEIEKIGGTYERIAVPGALEIPSAIRFAIRAMDLVGGRRRYDGYVALGCVIRGETTHYEIVSTESARGLMNLALDHTVAIGNGILTVETEAQAWARARVGEGNKGGDAARATISMIEVKRHFGFFPR
jgi:6,7-dimethyl-8-ribityllumazine synthase